MNPGVYLNLPEADYFSAGALGSTDLAKLAYDPSGWWWQSPNNPDYEREENEALKFGKLLHAYVLEGEEKFESIVVEKAYDDFRTKAAKAWRDEVENQGKVVLSKEYINSIYHMGNLILSHPELSGIRSGLNEVSVFWEDDGILFRVRFDCLLPTFSVDFKTYDGSQGQGDTPHQKALDIVAKRHYDIQRTLYETGREKLREFVVKGLVFAGTQEQIDKLKIITSRADWYWLWVFYQKIDHKKGKAPIVMPLYSMRADNAHEFGTHKIKVAIANYKDYLAQFGLETPWAQINKITKIDDQQYPYKMSFIPQSEFIEGAA